jgi:hypothetical protein
LHSADGGLQLAVRVFLPVLYLPRNCSCSVIQKTAYYADFKGYCQDLHPLQGQPGSWTGGAAMSKWRAALTTGSGKTTTYECRSRNIGQPSACGWER